MKKDINIKGHVTIKDGDGNILLEKSNSINSSHYLEIIARCMSNVSETIEIDQLTVYDTLSVQMGPQQSLVSFVQTYTYTDATNQESVIEFEFECNEASFNGIVGSLYLRPSNIGDWNKYLAWVTGLSITKDGASRLNIIWKITIT